MEGGGDLPFVKADAGLIERVPENLIDNTTRCPGRHRRPGAAE